MFFVRGGVDLDLDKCARLEVKIKKPNESEKEPYLEKCFDLKVVIAINGDGVIVKKSNPIS